MKHLVLITNGLVIMMVAAVLVSGCGSTGTSVRDRSTGEETAVIEGWKELWSGCYIHGPLPKEFVDTTLLPAGSRSGSLIVDAGPVKIMVRCVMDSPFGVYIHKATFHFPAEGGHTYVIVWKQKQRCIELVDATADGSVVACEPYYSGSYQNLSTTGETASIRAGEASRDKGNCKPFTWRRREARDFINVDAGPVSINATCFNTLFGRLPSIARFEFIAEAGHTYTITLTDN